MTPPVTLVIGSNGLLGSAVSAAVARTGPGRLFVQAVRWNDDTHVHHDLVAGLDNLLRAAAGERWRVVWCAGTGVTTTSADDLEREGAVLHRFLHAVADRSASLPTRQGAVFFASSAGGVYAGSANAPFDENTTPRPISAYGAAKLAAERAVHEFCRPAGVSVFIGRISNLYGPGQNVDKPQGLVTQLCLARVTGRPTCVYVSLDTLRDFLFVHDCAKMILDGLDQLDHHRPQLPGPGCGVVVTKILASQRSVSIGSLLMQMRRIFRRPPPVLLAASPFASAQARDLRLRSVVWPELDQRVLTPLPVGIRATAADIEVSLRSGVRA